MQNIAVGRGGNQALTLRIDVLKHEGRIISTSVDRRVQNVRSWGNADRTGMRRLRQIIRASVDHQIPIGDLTDCERNRGDRAHSLREAKGEETDESAQHDDNGDESDFFSPSLLLHGIWGPKTAEEGIWKTAGDETTVEYPGGHFALELFLFAFASSSDGL